MKWKVVKRIGIAFSTLVVLAVAAGIIFNSYATPTFRESIQVPIFTVGDQNYSRAIDSGKNVVKLGPLPLGIYSGGIAFRNYEGAAKHLKSLHKQDAGWGVYRLSGDFQLDTYECEGQTYINKSLLVVARASPGH